MPLGTVTSFDHDRGLGTITGDDGARFEFHCVSIGNGSRMIDAGSRVRFTIERKLGRHEATAIELVRPP